MSGITTKATNAPLRPLSISPSGSLSVKGSDREYNERVAEVASPTIIDLDKWIISPTQPEYLCEVRNSEGQPESSETAPPFALTPPAVLLSRSTPSNMTSETQLTCAFEIIMSTVPENIVDNSVTPKRLGVGSSLAIECNKPSLAVQQISELAGDRLLAVEALRLLTRLDRDLREARAQWNQDWFRRVMHARFKAVLRVRRRWEKLNPRPIPLGSLTRRYHANLARYLNPSRR